MRKGALSVSFLIILSAALLSFGVLFFKDDSASAALESKFIERVGVGLIAPACGSSTACGQAGNAVCTTCSGGAPSIVFTFIPAESYVAIRLHIFTPGSVDGTWAWFKPPNPPIVNSISQPAGLLDFIINGDTNLSGRFDGTYRIFVPGWNLGGSLNSSYNSILWDGTGGVGPSGLTWTKTSPAFPPVTVFSQIIVTNSIEGNSYGYTWNGGVSNTTYNYVIEETSVGHLVSRGYFTTPDCAPPPVPEDYSLSADPPILATIKSSQNAKSSQTTITAQSLGGFRGNERIDVVSILPPLPSGFSHTFDPSNRRVNIPADGSDTLTYSITVPPSTPKGEYTITFQGTGGSNPVATVELNVLLRDPGFREVLRPILDKLASALGLEALGFSE